MAETILAGKEVEKFAFGYGFALMAAVQAIFTQLAEYFLVCNRPCNT